MRNFSQTSVTYLFSSHDVNDEYCQGPETDLKACLTAIADVLEVGSDDVKKCFGHYLRFGVTVDAHGDIVSHKDDDGVWHFDTKLTPSEVRVVFDFAEFWTRVRSLESAYESARTNWLRFGEGLPGPRFRLFQKIEALRKSQVFFYANLNTGRSVSWVHYMC